MRVVHYTLSSIPYCGGDLIRQFLSQQLVHQVRIEFSQSQELLHRVSTLQPVEDSLLLLFDPVWVEPKPRLQPNPPVLIGAASKWAIRRVVDYADGWLPVAVGDQLDERLEQMQRLCEETGRDRDTLSV